MCCETHFSSRGHDQNLETVTLNEMPSACLLPRVGGIAKEGGLSSSRRLQRFTFDASFGGAAAQAAVYAEVAPVVTSVLDAYNVCIFAYGQTGSGKVCPRTHFGCPIGLP